MLLKWVLKLEQVSVNWIRLADDGQMVGCCVHGNEPSVSLKYGEIRD
jgi:hypothetical protein